MMKVDRSVRFKEVMPYSGRRKVLFVLLGCVFLVLLGAIVSIFSVSAGSYDIQARIDIVSTLVVPTILFAWWLMANSITKVELQKDFWMQFILCVTVPVVVMLPVIALAD